MKQLQLVLMGLLFSLFAAALVGKEAWLPKSAGPPACFAGEPPRSSTCHNSGCHTDFPVNSGGATLLMDLGGAENGYNPGQLYKVRIALTIPGLARGGFQTIAIQDNNDTISPGTFTLTELLRTQRIDRNFQHADTGCNIYSKVWIEHTDFGIDDPVLDTIRWEFDWHAPATDVGSITFYTAAVDANADLDPSGDHVYTFTRTIDSPSTTVSPLVPSTFQIYPHPVGQTLSIDLLGTLPHPSDRLAVYDLTGRMVLQSPLAPSISTNDLMPGVYLIKLTLDEVTWTRRFVKQ